MPNPYTFVNWGLLGEGKAPPANGLYFNNRKLDDVVLSVWREVDPDYYHSAKQSEMVYLFQLWLGTNLNRGAEYRGIDFREMTILHQAYIPLSIADELGLGGEYGHPDKFYSEKGPGDTREGDDDEMLWDMRLKEEYWHLLNPYWEGDWIYE